MESLLFVEFDWSVPLIQEFKSLSYVLVAAIIFRPVLKHNQNMVTQTSVVDKKTKLENPSKYSNSGAFAPGASFKSPSCVEG